MMFYTLSGLTKAFAGNQTIRAAIGDLSDSLETNKSFLT